MPKVYSQNIKSCMTRLCVSYSIQIFYKYFTRKLLCNCSPTLIRILIQEVRYTSIWLTATTIVSQWTWSTTLLQSCTVASKVFYVNNGTKYKRHEETLFTCMKSKLLEPKRFCRFKIEIYISHALLMQMPYINLL